MANCGRCGRAIDATELNTKKVYTLPGGPLLTWCADCVLKSPPFINTNGALQSMPTPKQGEKQKDYIARCMRYPDMQKYAQDQRYAICRSMWDSRRKKK